MKNKLSTNNPNPLIAHVTLSFGGGLQMAITEFVKQQRTGRHTIVTFGKEDRYQKRDTNLVVYGFLTSIKHILSSDIIFVHSTKAGFLRPIFKVLGKRVIYMPHSFHFSQCNMNIALQLLSQLVEKFLSYFTDYYVLLGWHEKRLLAKLFIRKQYSIVGNILPTNDHYANLNSTNDVSEIIINHPYIAICGRIHKQKAPEYFVKLIPTLRKHGYNILWIGGGNQKLTNKLLNAGVAVTGWIPPKKTIPLMQSASFIIHTASAEGLPMVFLEAWKFCDSRIVCADRDYAYFIPKKYKFKNIQDLDNILNNIKNNKYYFENLANVFNNRFDENRIVSHWHQIFDKITSLPTDKK